MEENSIFALSEESLKITLEQFNKINRGAKSLCLMPMGDKSKRFVELLEHVGIKVDFFCDNDIAK